MLGGHQFLTDLPQGTCERCLFDRRYVRVEICGSRRRVHQPGQQFVRHVGAIASRFRSDGQRIEATAFLILPTHRPEDCLQRHGGKHIIGKLCRLRKQRRVNQQRTEYAVLIKN